MGSKGQLAFSNRELAWFSRKVSCIDSAWIGRAGATGRDRHALLRSDALFCQLVPESCNLVWLRRAMRFPCIP